ncbi:MAG TPA: type IV secretion system protein, partial [Pseudoxanthomonas sp.]
QIGDATLALKPRRLSAGGDMEELSEFVFFRALYDFIHSEIDEFAIDLLARTMALVSTAALSVLTLWILIRGYRIVTGQSPQPMMGLVVDTLRTTLILGLACGMSLGGSTLYELLGSDLPNEISRVVTGDAAPINEQIDRNLALMQIAVGRIDALDVMGDTTLDAAKGRASWFAGLGTAGPAMSGGSLLLMNQIALALFIGLGPLFVLSLLFEQTKGLFGKWLYFGIGTMFSLAVLSVIVGISLDMVLKVGAAFWTSGVLMGSADGLTSLAMQQGCLGLVLTILILSAPPMAAQFFNGVLGNFSPFSAFGGGGRQNQPQSDSPAYSSSEPDTATASPVLAFRHSPSGVLQEGIGDEIKRTPEATTDDFRERYPNALASNSLIGGGDALPAASMLVAMGVVATAQDGYLRDLISPEKLQGLLAFQEDVRQRHPSDSDYAAARRATSDGFNAEISSAAEAYAKRVATDPDMPMQEKYDRLYGMGAKAGSAGVRLGIDYPEHGPIGGEADSIGRKTIDTYNLYNPSTPTTIYVESASDAALHLRNLLGVGKDADISHMILNHNPNEAYSSSGQFAIRNEDHRKRNDLVGQVIQQRGVLEALPDAISKHTFESVDNFAHGGERGQRWADKQIQDEQPFVARKESKTRAGRDVVKAVVGIGMEARTVANEPYITIDVFASKEDPGKRYFEIRKYAYDARVNDFVERAPLTNENTIQSLLHPDR